MRRFSLALFFFAAFAPLVQAGLTLSAGAPIHTHADANTGGNALLPAAVTITNATSGQTPFLVKDNGVGGILPSVLIENTTNGPVAFNVGNGSCTASGWASCRRWGFRKEFDAESSTATGTSWGLEFFDNAGAHLGVAIECQRNTGGCVFGNPSPFDAAAQAISAGVGIGTTAPPACANGGCLQVAGTFSSTKACATGYSRIGPNFCIKTAAQSLTGPLTRDVNTALTDPSSDSKAVLVQLRAVVKSNNAIGDRYSAIYFWGQTIVGGPIIAGGSFYAEVREFAATAAATAIGEHDGQVIIEKGANGYNLWFDDDTGNQGAGFYEIRGYFD